MRRYEIRFALDRLVPGVDNIRYDVLISPDFFQVVARFIPILMARQVRTIGVNLIDKKPAAIDKELTEFKKQFATVMFSAINKAKQEREPQIVFLAQGAVIKTLLEELNTHFEKVLHDYKQLIRKHEISQSHDLGAVFRIKEEMAAVQQKRINIMRDTAYDLFQHIHKVWTEDIEKGCVANFGEKVSLPAEFFLNPVLFIGGEIDDFFMIDEYVLLGHRFEDAVRYDELLAVLRRFIKSANAASQLITGPTADITASADTSDAFADVHDTAPDDFFRDVSEATDEPEVPDEKQDLDQNIDSMFCRVENIALLFDSQATRLQLKEAKKKKAPAEKRNRLRKTAKTQKKLLDCFYKDAAKSGLLKAIVAYYEMQPDIEIFCPPLLPHDLLVFLTVPAEREKITAKLKRLKSLAGESFSLKPLLKTENRIKRLSTRKKKTHLLNFLKNFVTYHRDFQNFNLLKESLQWINVVSDEKTANLSRVNNTLYEFLGPKERAFESKPIINHVVLKADVRGSTEITSQLSRKKLNPASYFSLNFFDPINNLLPEYSADKVFIEGDALILSILEEADTPQGWYSVARACGLAIQILRIVQRYNAKSKKHRLPVLEQGIGICFVDAPPAFLFDGDNRIMISSAINRADRLSGCTKSLRRHFSNKKHIFNLFVYQADQPDVLPRNKVDEEMQYLRYNVNGIELEAPAFKKLKQEIDLKTLELVIPEIGSEKLTFHTGIFPTRSGKYQRIVIREGRVAVVDPAMLKVKHERQEPYYEVCTHTVLYEKIKHLVQ
ncbi:MAG: hypothetical protein SWH68_15050 [Thermodesulfobacteriota bacterium]|nr:hypothetical protein [Thermodesulfobacteriota bacterium]